MVDTFPGRLDRGAVLDPGGAGIACADCAALVRGVGARPLEGAARRELIDAAAPLESAAERAADRDPDAEVGAQRAMSAILSRYLSRPLRSLEFIAKMNAPAPR